MTIERKRDESYIQTLKPTVWVGINGFSREIAEELKRQLKVRGVIKVKWLSSAEVDEEEVSALASLVSAEVLALRGKVAVLGAKNRGSGTASSVKPGAGAVSRRAEAHRRLRKSQFRV